jgi:hypothetical protein
MMRASTRILFPTARLFQRESRTFNLKRSTPQSSIRASFSSKPSTANAVNVEDFPPERIRNFSIIAHMCAFCRKLLKLMEAITENQRSLIDCWKSREQSSKRARTGKFWINSKWSGNAA